LGFLYWLVNLFSSPSSLSCYATADNVPNQLNDLHEFVHYNLNTILCCITFDYTYLCHFSTPRKSFLTTPIHMPCESRGSDISCNPIWVIWLYWLYWPNLYSFSINNYLSACTEIVRYWGRPTEFHQSSIHTNANGTTFAVTLDIQRITPKCINCAKGL